MILLEFVIEQAFTDNLDVIALIVAGLSATALYFWAGRYMRGGGHE